MTTLQPDRQTNQQTANIIEIHLVIDLNDSNWDGQLPRYVAAIIAYWDKKCRFVRWEQGNEA